jgi:hypothetical protein
MHVLRRPAKNLGVRLSSEVTRSMVYERAKASDARIGNYSG